MVLPISFSFNCLEVCKRLRIFASEKHIKEYNNEYKDNNKGKK